MTNQNNCNLFALTINTETIQFSFSDVILPDARESLAQRLAVATTIVVHAWEQLAQHVDLAEQLLLLLGHRPASWVVHEQAYPTALAATLAITIHRDYTAHADLVLGTAITAASLTAGETITHATAIRDWRNRAGLAVDSPRSYAKRIGRDAGPESQTGQAAGDTPQHLADLVLGYWQEVRDNDETDTPPVRYWHGRLYRWDGRVWAPMEHQSQEITRILQRVAPENVALTANLITSVARNIEAKTLFLAKTAPVWVAGEDPLETTPARVLVCHNCVLDLSNPTDGWRGSVLDHNARLFAVNQIPHDFHPDAECPQWERTFAEILLRESADDHRIEVIQEYMGYSLMPWANHTFEVFLLLFGLGSNGKSTITGTLAHLLGSANFSAVSLGDFGKRFSLAQMAGKLANIAPDMPWVERTDEGLLKQLVSGEATQAENKYRDPFDMIPTAKLWFATNPPLPRFNDLSDGLWRRAIVVPCRRTFTGGDVDRYRKDALKAEAAGILRWALDGLLRLMRQGHFTLCGVCERERQRYRADTDVLAQFLNEHCERGPNHQIQTQKLYSAMSKYRRQTGHRPIAANTFGTDLQRFEIARVRRPGGDREYLYYGVDLRYPNYVVWNHQRREWE